MAIKTTHTKRHRALSFIVLDAVKKDKKWVAIFLMNIRNITQ